MNFQPAEISIKYILNQQHCNPVHEQGKLWYEGHFTGGNWGGMAPR